jgi:alpha-1,6-mannosyltransferase
LGGAVAVDRHRRDRDPLVCDHGSMPAVSAESLAATSREGDAHAAGRGRETAGGSGRPGGAHDDGTAQNDGSRAADPGRGWAAALGSFPGLVRIGAVGAILLLIGSLGSGAMPGYDPIAHVPVLSGFRSGPAGLRVAMAVTYLGLALLTYAWLMIGRSLTADRPAGASVRDLRRTALLWGAPLLLAAPLFSRDLYSYAAQAQIVHAGLDPYTATPADLPGRFLDEVAWRWVDSPAPYGPLWLMLGDHVAWVTGEGVMRTVLAMRLLAVAGVLMCVWALPVLARRVGARPDLALWLGALNPMVLLHGVAGGHNDALMTGLAVAGLTVVAGAGRSHARKHDMRLLAAGSALLSLAIAVKSPAAIMLAFAVPLWAHQRGELARLRAWVAGSAIALASAASVFAVVTALSGVGMGWIRQVNSSIPVVNWLSLPTSSAMLWRWVNGVGINSRLDGTVEAFRTAGTVMTLVALAACWFAARRRDPLALCALGLGITVLLGPSVQPWYYVWALTVLAATRVPQRRRALVWLGFGSVALTLTTLPEGSSIVGKPLYLAPVLAAAAWASWSALDRR